MVRRPLPDAARHRIPRPEVILPSLLEAVRRRGGRDRHLDLAAHQSDQFARKHPADAPARRPDPEQGGEPPRAGSVAPQALGAGSQLSPLLPAWRTSVRPAYEIGLGPRTDIGLQFF